MSKGASLAAIANAFAITRSANEEKRPKCDLGAVEVVEQVDHQSKNEREDEEASDKRGGRRANR